MDENDEMRSHYDEQAEIGIMKILETEGVVYRNELHYRLEDGSRYQLDVSEIFHERTDAAIRRLERDGKIKETGPLGRPPATLRLPLKFYRFPDVPVFRPLHDEMRRKTDCVDTYNASSSGMGFHAQNLWTAAIDGLGFNIVSVNFNEYKGTKSVTPGDLDIIAEFGGIPFGFEIKNGLAYPRGLRDKFRIAAEIGLIPFIITRNLSYGDRVWLHDNGGLFKIYRHSIFSENLKSSLERCVEILGLPFIFRDIIDNSVLDHFMGIISDWTTKIDSLEEKLLPLRL